MRHSMWSELSCIVINNRDAYGAGGSDVRVVRYVGQEFL